MNKSLSLILLLVGCSVLDNLILGRSVGNFDFYKEQEDTPVKRYKTKDLMDNDIEPSLWVFEDKEGSLHFKTKEKKIGDIVTIKLQDKMKSIIIQELKRTIVKKSEEEDPYIDTYLDKIPGVIIEKLEDEFIVKCRKNILFEGLKKSIQIEGLVARNDFVDYSVDSDKLIEYSVTVVR